jgi:hypothetical protein
MMRRYLTSVPVGWDHRSTSSRAPRVWDGGAERFLHSVYQRRSGSRMQEFSSRGDATLLTQCQKTTAQTLNTESFGRNTPLGKVRQEHWRTLAIRQRGAN